ncbi:MAG TPA: hypothetical protein VLV83_26620 [Acidobacteriota bacterium]|nr:hypothetical protein [Acidobacteriota bacterium]
MRTGAKREGGIVGGVRRLSGWMTLSVLAAASLWTLAQELPGKQPKFFPDDPVWEDEDNLDVPRKPSEIELSDLFDRFSNTFHDFGSDEWGEADNVNTLDEVPDSSWFTNRHGLRRLSIEELVRGPNTGPGPDPSQPWTIFRGKQQGITPGFHVIDDKGARYVVKFGTRSDPRLSTAAEVIATKILYAVGYHVPENYIVYMDPSTLRIKPGTTVTDSYGDEVPLTQGRLRQMLRKATAEPDGTYRIIASKYIEGEPLGPFRYYGRRSDDPNDLYPHEQRRELRGLRLISAWINHDDSRAHNTQATWVEENGKHYVRHYLIDFGSTFGSGTAVVQDPSLTFSTWMDGGQMADNALGFGFHVPEYRKVEWPDLDRYSAVGRFESEHFDPAAWYEEYPNAAFVRESQRDAFWAARLTMRFSQDELRAIVHTGQFNDPDQEAYFLKTLIERQRKCGAYGILPLNPLDEFRLTGNAIEFTNLAEEYSLGSSQAPAPGPASSAAGASSRAASSSAGASPSTYQARWGIYDNAADQHKPLGDPSTHDQASIPIASADLGENEFLTLTLLTENPFHPDWKREVRLYLRSAPDGYRLAGIDRESTPSLPPEGDD